MAVRAWWVGFHCFLSTDHSFRECTKHAKRFGGLSRLVIQQKIRTVDGFFSPNRAVIVVTVFIYEKADSPPTPPFFFCFFFVFLFCFVFFFRFHVIFLLHGLFLEKKSLAFTREQTRFWQRINLTLLLIHFGFIGRYVKVGQTKVERRRAKPAVQPFSRRGSGWYVGVWRLGRSTDKERSVEMELW